MSKFIKKKFFLIGSGSHGSGSEAHFGPSEAEVEAEAKI
jgi:hypothetical protein